MLPLPDTNDSLLIRTDFADGLAWKSLVEEVRRENSDGFRAYVELVDETGFASADPLELKAAVAMAGTDAAVLFVADSQTLGQSGFPILVIDLLEDRPSFRCLARDLWSADNNLNIANMGWEEFSTAMDDEGVFRGVEEA
jgi:hypothetical protein